MLGTNLDVAAFADLATGIVWLGGDLRIGWANPAFSELTGFGLVRLKAQTLAVLQPDGARLHAAATRAQAEGHPQPVAGVVVAAAPGAAKPLDFTLTPHTDGLLVEAHPAIAAPAPARVSESLRGFAHEVRNPLAAISGAAQLLQQGASDARQHELAQLIRAEAARLATLTERLLGTRSATATRAVNVHAILEHAAGLLEAEHAPVTLVRDYDPSLPAWYGDPDRLLQAVLNLIRNALEAHARRIVLRSRAEAGWRDARGLQVPALRIEIVDDGDGVPAALAATLFEPMVSGRADGSGLGLALAREIAREHGGELSLRPTDTGTCFALQLPRHPRPEAPE